MATFASTLVPGEQNGAKVAGLAAATASAEQNVGNNNIIAVSATGAYYISFGVTGMAAATNTSFLIPAGVVSEWDMGRQFTHFRVFNGGAAAIDVHWIRLSKF